MKKILIYSVSLLSVFGLSLYPVQAAQFQAGQEYILDKNTTLDENLYIAGSNILINGNVNADVIAAGQTVNVYGRVSQDVNLAGANLNIIGDVAGDVRVFGGNITIGGNVAGDTIAFGGTIHIAPSSNLNKDAVMGGGSVIIDGNLNEKAKIRGGSIIINGKISKDTEIEATQELVIGSSAVIDGKIVYKSSKQARVLSGAKINTEMVFNKLEKPEVPRRAFFGALTISWLIKFLAILLAALLAFYIFRKKSETLIKYNVSNFGKELLRGFILLILIPIAVILCWITIIGMIPGFIGLFLYILLGIIAYVYTGILFGGILFKYLFKSRELEINWKTIVTGIIVLQIILFIPVVGWLIGFIFFLSSFGGLFYFLYKSFWLER